jgi:hypothetical protein
VHHILSVDYRLAPTAPWPLPLLDAISAYHYLVHNQGIDEQDIVLFGDSAGGHLALALARYLRDEGPALGLRGPRALVLMSPWVDVGFTNAWGDAKWHNADSDTIDDTFGPFATSLLLRAVPIETMHTSSYLSPGGLLLPETDGLFDRFPPTFVVYGGAERLSTSIAIFWDRLNRPGDKLVEGADCVHDFLIFPWQEEEAAGVYSQLDEWLREILSEDAEDDGAEAVATVGTPTDETTAPLSITQILRSPPPTSITSPTLVPNTCPLPSPGPISPISPILAHSFPTFARRRDSRRSLKTDRSPVIQPSRPGVGRMVDDMRSEAMTYLDLPPLPPLPPLDLDGDWLTPFTAQQEKGEWDWEFSPRERERESKGESEDRAGLRRRSLKGVNEEVRDWYEVGSDSGTGSPEVEERELPRSEPGDGKKDE